MTAASILLLGTVGCSPNPDNFAEAIKGDWQCSGVSTSRNATSGDVYLFGIKSDDSSGGFGFYAGMTYDLKIDAETWKVVQTPYPQEASGKYKVDNGKLVFSIENYRFSADSPRSKDTPDQGSVGKDFTISDLPAKINETAHPHLNGDGDGKSTFNPISQGFRIQRTDASYVDCIKAPSK